MKKLSIFFLLIALLLSTNAQAQTGGIDPSFNSTDVGFGRGDAANANVFTSSLQANGKIIIGGVFTEYEGKESNYLARLNADGSLDASFNIGTGLNSSVFATAIQSDGKIIIGGNFTAYNGVTKNYLARLNTDGSLDATFTIGTGPDDQVHAIAIQNDGKIIIGGDFTMYNGVSRGNVARLNSNGSLDVTFNVGTGADYGVSTLAIQSDGKVIIGGNFGTYNSTAISHLARLSTNGTLDATFNAGADNVVLAVAIQSNGKIVISGLFSTCKSTARNGIARLNADSSLDGTFNPGTGADDEISDLAIQSDGKIIIGGLFTTYNGVSRNRIGRVNSDGTLDATFNVGTGVDEEIETVLIQGDGKVIIGGLFVSYNEISRNNIARLNTNGSLDVSFNNVGTGVNGGVIQTIAMQSDGKMIIGGFFTAYNGIVTNNITRINTDGSLDVSFNPGMATKDYTFFTTAIQSDGKILIGGELYNRGDGSITGTITRLNTNGSVDGTFNIGLGADSTILASAIQSDGKVIIVGYFKKYNGTSRNQIARLNTNGSLDATFNVGTGTNKPVFTTAIQSDGKIIIAGNFTSYNGTAVNHIARLNTNGSLDGTFNIGIGANNDVNTIRIQSDGKIIISGNFTTYNGTARNRIARLNTNGSLDATFNVGTGANSYILTSVIQGDGKTIIGGVFTAYNGTARNGIARLNADGSLDATFDVGTGTNGSVLAIVLQSDEKIVIGGDFTSYNGVGRNRITRLIGLVVTENEKMIVNNNGLTIYPNPNNGGFVIESSNRGLYSIISEVGQTVKSFELSESNNHRLHVDNLNPGIYFITGLNKNKTTSQKVVVNK